MPLEMRPRRPLFAASNGGGGPGSIASSGGPVPAPSGGAPGAVSTRAPATATAAGAGGGLGAFGGNVALGQRSALAPVAKPGMPAGGNVLGTDLSGKSPLGPGGAMSGTRPLGGQRQTTLGDVQLGATIGQRNTTNAQNLGQLGGPVARDTTNLGGAPLSHYAGGGGTARTTSRPDYENAADAAGVSRTLGAASKTGGAVIGTNAGGAAPAVPGAVAGPGAQPRGAPTGGIQTQAPTPAPQSTFVPNANRDQTGLFGSGGITGKQVGNSAEGYNLWQNDKGEIWAETENGWVLIPDGSSRAPGTINVHNYLPPDQGGTQGAFGTTKRGSTASDSGEQGGASPGRKYSNAGGQFGSTSSGLTSGSAAGPTSGAGAANSGARSGEGSQGYSSEAAAKAQATGQDPWLIQALLDMGISLNSITSEGVSSVEDPDFGISGSAEWNDVNDDEAGALYAAGKRSQENKAAWEAQSAQRGLDQRIGSLLDRLNSGEFAAPGIDLAVVERMNQTRHNALMEQQSRTLGAQLAGSAASGLSPEAANASAAQNQTQFGIADASQEAQLRYNAELANMQGRMQQYNARISMLQQLLQGPAAQASAALQAKMQQALMEMQAAAQREMQTWQTNQVTGWDYLRDSGSAALQGGIGAGANAFGSWLGT